MSNRSDKQGAFQSVRWSLLLAFVRTTAAALVVFVGLAWGGLVILYPFAGLQQLTTAQWTAVVSVLVLSGAAERIAVESLRVLVSVSVRALRLADEIR